MASLLKTKDLLIFDPKIVAVVEETSPQDHTTHYASCHCGAVVYNVTLKHLFPKYTVLTCNCSICEKNGYLLVYPARRDVVFEKGMLLLSYHGTGLRCVVPRWYCRWRSPG